MDIDAKLEIMIDNVLFEQVDCFKYLGLYLDPKLNFNQHIERTCAKAKYKLSTLGMCRQYISQDISLLLYKSLLLPVLEYGDIVYASAGLCSLDKLQKVQNTALRIVLQADRRSNVKEMHKLLHILMLKDRRDIHISTQMYKCLNSLSPDYLCILFEYLSLHHGINTRAVANRELNVPRSRTSAGEQCFGTRGAVLWNGLPQDIKELSTLDSFVSALTRLMEQEYNFK